MKFLRGLYTVYGLMVFAFLFFVFFPFFFIPIIFKKKFQLTGRLNRWWAKLLFTLIGMPFNVQYRFNPDPDKQYIFCPNHFSYLDIPTMGLNRHNTVFVGKSEMEKIPLFGFMYRKLHITVDRTKLKSRYSTILQSLQAIDEGKSLVIYPEGGITSTTPPALARFKDGAFRIAIEKHIPVVPVTIPHNWVILPDPGMLLRWRPVKMIFHEPIETASLTLDNVDELKQQVYQVIEEELVKHYTHEN